MGNARGEGGGVRGAQETGNMTNGWRKSGRETKQRLLSELGTVRQTSSHSKVVSDETQELGWMDGLVKWNGMNETIPFQQDHVVV